MLLGLQTGSHMVHRWATWALQRSKRGFQEESILEGLLWTSLMYSYVAKVHFDHLWPDIWHKIEKPPTRFVPFWLAWWWPTTSMLRGGRWWSEVLASLPSLNSWYTAGIQLQQGLPGLSKLCLAYANSKHPQNITKPLCNVTWWKFKNFQNFDGSPKVNDFSLFVCVKRDHRLPRGVLFCTSAISPADNHYFFRMVFEIGRRHVQRDLCMSHVCGKCKWPWWVPAQHILYHPAFFIIFQECLVIYSLKCMLHCYTERYMKNVVVPLCDRGTRSWTLTNSEGVTESLRLNFSEDPHNEKKLVSISTIFRWDGCAVKNVILWYWTFHA